MIVTSDQIDDYLDLFGLLSSALELADAPALRRVICLGETRRSGALTEGELLEAAESVPAAEIEHRRSARARARRRALLYTSGTTAHPRGCRLTHEAIVRNWSLRRRRCLRLGAGDRMWAPCPLFHLGAIGPLVALRERGRRVPLGHASSSPSARWRSSPRERATHLYPAYPPITQGAAGAAGLRARPTCRCARAMLNVAPAGHCCARCRRRSRTPSRSRSTAPPRAAARSPTRSLDDDLETRVTTCGLPAARLRGAHRRSRDRRRAAVDEPARSCVRSFGLFDGVPERPGEDRGRLRRRRLVPHGRPRHARRATAGCASSAA